MKHMIKFTGLYGEPCFVFKKAFLKRLEEIKSLDPDFIGSKLSDGRKATPALIYKCLRCRVPENDKIAQGVRSYYKHLAEKKGVEI